MPARAAGPAMVRPLLLVRRALAGDRHRRDLPQLDATRYCPRRMFMDTAFRSEERFTQEEFWDWLETLPDSAVGRYELINGRIVVTPPAGWPHGLLEATLCRIVGQHVSDRR